MTISFSLQGSVALVTGAASGIGAAIAMGLADAGAEVVCHGNRRSAHDTVEAIRGSGHRALAVRGDLAEAGAPEKIVGEALEAFGRVDILVNNAGMIQRAPASEVSAQDWGAVLTVNLTSAFRLCQLVGSGMLERGRGKIVNVASLLSFQGGHSGAGICRVQGRARADDQGAGERMGRSQRQRQRDRAGLHAHR